jgi:hypothetical protein
MGEGRAPARSTLRRDRHGRTVPRRRHFAAVAAAVLVVAIAPGCGSDAPGSGSGGGAAPGAAVDGEVPTPRASFFTEGELDDIRLPGGASEISGKTEEDGAITQSFAVTEMTPPRIMGFFEDSLPSSGWETVEPVAPRGTDAVFGAWARDGRRLEVSAGPAPEVDDERSQFSLVLLPSLVPGDEIHDQGS